MTEERALAYRNALWLVDQIGERAEDGDVPASFAQAAASMLGAVLVHLRRTESRKSRRSWERALARHHLSLARDA